MLLRRPTKLYSHRSLGSIDHDAESGKLFEDAGDYVVVVGLGDFGSMPSEMRSADDREPDFEGAAGDGIEAVVVAFEVRGMSGFYAGGG
jgi:hypothetical protein